MANTRGAGDHLPVDLSTCDREPIHIPGLIQPHGCLLLLDNSPAGDLTIVLASANTHELLGRPATELLGAPLSRVLHAEDTEEVVRRVTAGPLHLHPVYIHAARGAAVPNVFNAVAHRLSGRVILELEPALPGEGANASEHYRRLQTAMVDLRQAGPVRALCEKLATHIRRITGFDRVMVYQFDADWHGEVIAEDRRENLEPFLGLHYPAADIPSQARALYTRNWLRFIPDRDYVPVPLVPSAIDSRTGLPLDMSHCVLRSVSPIHLEYLRNMGVAASMSVSLLRDGQLWGLVACHHYQPRRVPYDVRAACELIGQVVSLQLAHREQAEIADDIAHKRAAVQAIADRLTPGPEFEDSLAAQSEAIFSLIQSGGAAIVAGERITRVGQAPTVADIQAIADLVHATNAEIFATDKLDEYLPRGSLPAVASGVLAIPFTRTGRHCIIWFRPEQVRVVNWAGDPAKSVVKGEAPARLSPRGSFALWKETVRGRSLAWTPTELAAAAELRKAMVIKLLEHANDVLSHNAVLQRASVEKDQTIDSERAARAQAERINRLTDEFVATLSHELRTPLNAIQGWVQLLRARAAGGEVAEGLDVIDRNARVQSQMVNDLLDMSRINSGKLRLDVQSVDLPSVVEAALKTVQFSAQAKSIRVHTTIDPLSGISVSGDPQRLQQIVWNLLSNAVKFTPKGGLIQVELKRSGSYVELNVRDNGIGIPRDFLPHVFDRFRQADASTTRSYGGLGLGLSIVRHLTEMHGGTISATSAGPSAGSTFTVTLPIRSVASPGPNEPHPSAEGGAGTGSDAPDVTGLSVLLIEDEPDAREFVRRLLADHGVTTSDAGSVAEALVMLNDRTFDLIVSDIGMPGEDGYAFIRQLRELELRRNRARTPCIALTAYARTEDRRRLMLAGFQAHVAKPVEASELLAVIANVGGRI
jgi:chemotaxis family two-component system sensor kinase Cph1